MAKAPESLHAFVQLAFNQVEPKTPFIDGRLVHVLCEYLEAVSRGEIKLLAINVPPGFMKSLLVCVFWPAWDWLTHQERRAIYASYDPSLSLRDAKRTYELVISRWFVERWGRVLRTTRQPFGDYYTIAKGNRFSTSIHGRATGRHFHWHVADDPIKPRDALGGASFSEVMLNDVNTWWDQTMSTRTADWENLVRVIVMQRLHDKDLTGHALASGGYVHVRIPMHYDPSPCVVQVPHQCCADWRKKEGELAWPERCNKDAVRVLEKGLRTEAAIASQLEQRPVPKGGLIFDSDHFRYWHDKPNRLDLNGRPCVIKPHPDAGVWFQSWDMTFADTDGSDMVCGGVWQGIGGDLYIHDGKNKRLSFTQSCRALITMTKGWPKTHRKLIENKANGPACENILKKKVSGIQLVEPEGGKIVRAMASTTYSETGNIFFPHPDLCPWVSELVDNLIRFPYGRYDDWVDMTTQAIIHYFKRRNRLVEVMKDVEL